MAELRVAKQAAMPTLRLLGSVRLEFDDRSTPLRLPSKGLELLGYLCARTVPTSRDALATLLWPDHDAEDARANLRRQLHNITRALPEHAVAYVLATNASLQWNPLAPIVVDVVAFRAALATRDDPCAWYGGDFLEGHFEDWMLSERERLRSHCVGALFDRIRRKRGERDLRGALDDAIRLLEIDPWREDVVRIEMALRNALGDRGGALAGYRKFSERLLRELETDPMPETRALFESISHGESTDDAAVREPAAALTEAKRGLPFRGREAEFALMTDAWSCAARGAASMLLVGGEAGVGKSRLVQELALHAEAQGAHVFVGTTPPGEGSPHQALIEALRAALPLVERAASDVAALGPLLPLLPELDARHDLGECVPIEDPKARARLFDAVATAIASLAATRPLLLIFEDVHWAGAASLDLLQFLVRRGGTHPILFVATYRAEETRATHPLRALRKRLEAESLLRSVSLERLDAASTTAIVRAVLGDGVSDANVAEIVAKSDGLPLFLNEAIRDPNRSLDAAGLNVAPRLEALPDDARMLVEIAAVAGAGFDIDLLCEASGWTEGAVVRALGPIVASRLVREPHRRTRNDYVFSHHLIAAAIYDSIARRERSRRHQRIGDALVRLCGEPADERAAEIASHYLRGDRRADAATWYGRAAAHAASLWATEDALEFSRLAIDLDDRPYEVAQLRLLRTEVAHAALMHGIVDEELARLDESVLTLEQRANRQLLRKRRLSQQGLFEEGARAIEGLGPHLSEVSLATRLAYFDELAHHALIGNDFDALQKAARYLEENGAGTRYDLSGTFHRGAAAMQRNAFDEMLEINRRAIGRARETGDLVSEAVGNFYVGVACSNIATHFDEAEIAYARARDLLERCDYRRVLTKLEINEAALFVSRARYAEAIVMLERFEEQASQRGEQRLGTNRLNWAMCEASLGNAARARELLRDCGPLDDTIRNEGAWWWMIDGLAAWTLGDLPNARESCVRSGVWFKSLGQSGYMGQAMGFAALATLACGDADAARSLAREAASLGETMHEQCDFPHVAQWALAAASCDSESRVALEAALRIFERRAALLGTAERRAAYERVPWNAEFLRGAPVAH